MEEYLNLQTKLTNLKNQVIEEIINKIKPLNEIKVDFWLNENDRVLQILLNQEGDLILFIENLDSEYELKVTNEMNTDDLFHILYNLNKSILWKL